MPLIRNAQNLSFCVFAEAALFSWHFLKSVLISENLKGSKLVPANLENVSKKQTYFTPFFAFSSISGVVACDVTTRVAVRPFEPVKKIELSGVR